MLQASCQAVLETRTRDRFRSEVVRFAQNLGFHTVSATAVFDRPSGTPEFVTVDNTPSGFRDKFESMERNVRDPVMQHCKHSGRPIVWDQSTYVKAGLGGHWEEQAAFGYKSGIAVALHMPEGRHFFVGVDFDGCLTTREPRELRRLTLDLQRFTVHAQEAARRVLVPPSAARNPVEPAEELRLAPRELEALRWTLEGKTAWEAGNHLGMSERTVVLHVDNAMRKLHCATKLQAALKARRMGLLR